MQKISFYVFLFASIWMMQSCSRFSKKHFTEEGMIYAAKTVDAKFVKGMNSENIDSVMSCYWNNPDLVIYPPDAPQEKGYNAVKASFIKFFETTEGVKHEMIEANYRMAGDMVYSWGKMKMTMPNPDTTAADIQLEGRFTSIYAFKDSALVYVHDHASIPLPPPAAVQAIVEKGK